MNVDARFDVIVVGSGAGGGTVAAEMAPLVAAGKRILVLEQGARLRNSEYSGKELEMVRLLYEDGAAVLNRERTMTFAFGRAYGGSTVVYTGTSLPPPDRVIRRWGIAGLDANDLRRRTDKYCEQNSVHLLEEELLNDNNRLFRDGAKKAGFHVEQFPLNVRGCKGSSLCNLGCPNAAKQGTNRVQLPHAESLGVEVVTRAQVLRIGIQEVFVRIGLPTEKGEPSVWKPGEYRVGAKIIVVCGGAVGSPALLLRSQLPAKLPKLGADFTCHPAHVLVAQHDHPITNDVGHPKSFFIDRAAEEGFVLETCMYFPFTTAKNLTGFGEDHESFLKEFRRLQMILILACDHAVPENRISIDRHGKAVIHYRMTPAVIRSLVAGTRAAARVFFAAGAARVHVPAARPHVVLPGEVNRLDERIHEKHFLPGMVSVSAAHLMGGCKMGQSAADSVTDAWGRVHGLPWLRVADSSLFPDALEINPYLTIMALADRVAEKVKAEVGTFS
jgi:choline dehydrogenase-like flavoprotein